MTSIAWMLFFTPTLFTVEKSADLSWKFIKKDYMSVAIWQAHNCNLQFLELQI